MSKFLCQDTDVMSLADNCIVVGCVVYGDFNKIIMESGKLSDNIRVTEHGLVSALVVEFSVLEHRRSTWSTPKECQLQRLLSLATMWHTFQMHPWLGQSSGTMNIRQVPCILGSRSKDLSVLYYALYWDHLSLYSHMGRTEIVNQSSSKVGDPRKDLESRVAVRLLCNSRFWKQQNMYSYRKCMATPCIESTEGILFWTDFWFKMLLTFKAAMPLLANLTFRNRRFLVSAGSPTLIALNSLFEEISKAILWSWVR